jgi:hypothetical protein
MKAFQVQFSTKYHQTPPMIITTGLANSALHKALSWRFISKKDIELIASIRQIMVGRNTTIVEAKLEVVGLQVTHYRERARQAYLLMGEQIPNYLIEN